MLKKFIKKKWHENGDFIAREFQMFLEWCVDVVGVFVILHLPPSPVTALLKFVLSISLHALRGRLGRIVLPVDMG